MMSKVRLATLRDAAAFVSIIRRGFDQSMRQFIIYGCSGAVPYVKAHIGNRIGIREAVLCVAEDNRAISGAIDLRVTRDALHLAYISTAKRSQGKGVATRLLRFAIEEALKTSSPATVSLDVFSDNLRAKEWYLRLGMVESGRNEWWGIKLFDSKIPAGQVLGLPQARACHAAFGFSQVEVVTARGRYSIGLLGAKWYRLVSASPPDDRELVATLKAIDASRKLLLVMPSNERREFRGGERLAVTHRLGASIVTCLAGLAGN